MPEQELDGPDVRSGFKQMGGEAVPQGMDRNVFAQARASRPALHAICTGLDVIGRSGFLPGKSQGWSEAPFVADKPSNTREEDPAVEGRA